MKVQMYISIKIYNIYIYTWILKKILIMSGVVNII